MSRRIPLRKEFYLPRADRAWIPEGKLKDYVLNPDHPRGKNKAILFADRLAIERGDWRYLHDQILREIPYHRVVDLRLNWPYGLEMGVILPVAGLNGESCLILTGWLLDRQNLVPRFSTARPIP